MKDLTLADELERLAKEATPGELYVSPFEINAGGKARMVMGGDGFSVAYVGHRSEAENDANAALIIALRNALPQILSALRGEWQGIETAPMGEPVAWRWRQKFREDAPWNFSYGEPERTDAWEVQPLYARPPVWPDREAVALADCPPGLFLFNGTLGFKTEYRGMETVGPVDVPGDQVRWRVGKHSEVYVVSSGEVFWGGVTTKDDREALLVTPVDADAILDKMKEG